MIAATSSGSAGRQGGPPSAASWPARIRCNISAVALPHSTQASRPHGTPAGKRATKKCDAALQKAQERILSRLPAAQRIIFMSALEAPAFPAEADQVT